MTDVTLRRIVGSALILLLVYQVATAVIGLANAAAGGATAIFVAAVTFFCAQRANAGTGNKIWFMVPALLFTVLPLVLKVWELYSSETSTLLWIVAFTPLFVGFLLPALLLWLAYAELRRRTRTVPVDTPEAGREVTYENNFD